MNQLPLQDFDANYCKTLDRKERQAMNKLADMKREAAGRGTLVKCTNLANSVCEGCKNVINTGDKAVFAKLASQDKYWHPECFVCFGCKEQIADFIYFLHEGNIYCGRHFAEQFRPRCAACDEVRT